MRVCCCTQITRSDGTIISGDSLGLVKFWDSRTCTQLQSFQGHGADVLCLAIGPVSFNFDLQRLIFTVGPIVRMELQYLHLVWIKRQRSSRLSRQLLASQFCPQNVDGFRPFRNECIRTMSARSLFGHLIHPFLRPTADDIQLTSLRFSLRVALTCPLLSHLPQHRSIMLFK